MDIGEKQIWVYEGNMKEVSCAISTEPFIEFKHARVESINKTRRELWQSPYTYIDDVCVCVCVCVCVFVYCQKRMRPHVLLQRRLKVNWKLLIWLPLSHLVWSRIDIHSTCSDSLSPLSLSSLPPHIAPSSLLPFLPSSLPPFFPSHRFRCVEQPFTFRGFEIISINPPLRPTCSSDYPCSVWVDSVVSLPDTWLTWYAQLHTDVDTVTVLPAGSGRAGESGGETCRPWRVCLDVLFLTQLPSGFSRGNVEFSRDK